MTKMNTLSSASDRSGWTWWATTCSAILILTITPVAAQEVTQYATNPDTALPFSFGRAFTFLFLTLGPFKVIPQFTTMTRGRDAAFGRRLAVQSIMIATMATLVASTLGTKILRRWEISFGALQVAAGIILFLVALRAVFEQFVPKEPQAPASLGTQKSSHATFQLAFSPLAFPTIVTPYGIAVLILMMTLRSGETANQLRILGVAAVVLAIDFLAMLISRNVIMSALTDFVLGIVGAITAVLQIALGVQTVVVGLRVLGILEAKVGHGF